jgi:hypothetical protein
MWNRLVGTAAVAFAVGLCGVALDAGHARAQRGGDSEEDRAPSSGAPKAPDKLVYADFENSTDGRPISSRGGRVSLSGYQENPSRISVFKGHDADNNIPKLVRTSKEDQNHAAAFDYELVIPNQWAGVTMRIDGSAGEEGALPADDVSGYKVLNLQVYVTGSSYMRVEVMSQGAGINYHSGYPMTSFKLKEGFNIYKVPLKSFSQPSWVSDTRIDPKQVLKQLTSVTVAVFCDDCRPTKGMVIVDNLVFEK